MLELPILQNPKQDALSLMDSDMPLLGNQPSLYVETYGCQMNVNDTEIVQGVMHKKGIL